MSATSNDHATRQRRHRREPSPSVPTAGETPDSDPDIPGTIGTVLRLARRRREWTLREVERRTGIANAYLSQIERGAIRKPDAAILWQLSDVYGLDFVLLARWSGHIPAELSGDAGITMTVALHALAAMDETSRRHFVELLISSTEGGSRSPAAP